MRVDVDIVIVGGGAAGIGAARRLAQAGRSALLLEATPRLGGRAHSERIHGMQLDLGCGWLHSADRNAWVAVANGAGLIIDRSAPAWGVQFRDLGFSPAEQADARQTFGRWMHRMSDQPPDSDCAADALEPDAPWNSWLRAIVGFISGARLERLSIADYIAYDEASSESNWRVPMGYGALIVAGLPDSTRVRLATPVESIALNAAGVTVGTRAGSIQARAVIFTVSTHVLTGDAIKLPAALDPWRQAASNLPVGHNEKLFLQIHGGYFERETQVVGDPRDPKSGAYYIRPLGLPVIESFLGGESAEVVVDEGPAAGFAFALDQLAGLFGSDARRWLKPLAASSWAAMDHIGGAYSYALPGKASARAELARPFEQRLFFAGEATSRGDFSTAHGAHDTGVRAADEAIASL
ncbi:MAG TPA: NAD(P)/FAD-dependent oxidoreductase [Steroidobacteraceae bacterium]|nr:NAD(P)/FAD-dependent oxidoreductase [Steroidobacteraceae bacterium]